MSREMFAESLMMPFMKAALTEKDIKNLERLVEDCKTKLQWSDGKFCLVGDTQKEVETLLALRYVFEAIKHWNIVAEKSKKEPDSAHKRWSKQEECYLIVAFIAGRTISEIAEDLMRTKEAVRTRLNWLGISVPKSRY
jgi:hypothetical protein